MGFRMRRSFRIAKGLRLNVSKSGFSLSAGGRGATVNVSSRGVRGTVGIPGTGLSFSQMLTSTGQRARSSGGTIEQQISAYYQANPAMAEVVTYLEQLVSGSIPEIRNYGRQHGYPLELRVIVTPDPSAHNALSGKWVLNVCGPDEATDPVPADAFIFMSTLVQKGVSEKRVVLELLHGIRADNIPRSTRPPGPVAAAPPARRAQTEDDGTGTAIVVGCLGVIAVIALIALISALLR